MELITDLTANELENYCDVDFVCSWCGEPMGQTDDPATIDEYDCWLHKGKFFHSGCFSEHTSTTQNQQTGG